MKTNQEPAPPVESLDSILEDTHRIGLHSDDRGGDSDKPCYCMVKPALQRLIQTSNRESYKKGYNAGRMKHMWRKYHKPARVHKNICPVCKQIQTLTKEEE